MYLFNASRKNHPCYQIRDETSSNLLFSCKELTVAAVVFRFLTGAPMSEETERIALDAMKKDG